MKKGDFEMKVNYGKCSITVLGIDLKCFLCGVLVKSGESHECETRKAVPVGRPVTRKKALKVSTGILKQAEKERKRKSL